MSTATVAQADERLLSAEEYATLPDDRRTELVAGRIIELKWPGFLHGVTQATVASLLAKFVEKYDVGHAVIGTGIITERRPDTVRGADVSFFSFNRIPKTPIPEGYPEAAPEVVFEIRSLDDCAGEVLRKAGEYITAGTAAVCVIDPRRRNAVVYGEDDSVAVLSAADTLRLPAPLADWTPRVGDFFVE